MLEKSLESRLVNGVKAGGGRALKFVSPGNAGVPDRIVLYPGGRLWFVEMKAPGRKPRPLQRYWLDLLHKLGFRVLVISNNSELDAFFREVGQ